MSISLTNQTLQQNPVQLKIEGFVELLAFSSCSFEAFENLQYHLNSKDGNLSHHGNMFMIMKFLPYPWNFDGHEYYPNLKETDC